MSTIDNEIPQHHVKLPYCETRPKYRRTKRKTAVKIFTVNLESKYLIVTGIPATGLEKELIKLFSSHGMIQHSRELIDYPREEFTQVYLIQYRDIQTAKVAKRKLDEHYFYGGTLHTCYAPEYESVSDTRDKLYHRRQSVTARVKFLNKEENHQLKKKKVKTSHFKSHDKSEKPFKSKIKQGLSSKQDSTPPVGGQSKAIIFPQSISQAHSNSAIPCNSFGIPLHLPPPPLPNLPPPPLPNVTVSYSNGKNRSSVETTSTKTVGQKPTISNDSVSLPKQKVRKSTSKLNTKNGYFYQKVLHQLTLQSKSPGVFPDSHLMNRNLSASKISCQRQSKTSVEIPVPKFLPRHIELQHIDEINKIETGPDGKIPLLGSFIHSS